MDICKLTNSFSFQKKNISKKNNNNNNNRAITIYRLYYILHFRIILWYTLGNLPANSTTELRRGFPSITRTSQILPVMKQIFFI